MGWGIAQELRTSCVLILAYDLIVSIFKHDSPQETVILPRSVLFNLSGVELLANRMAEDSEDELEEVQSNHGMSQEERMEVQYGCGDSGGAHCLALPSSNGTIVYVSNEDLQKCTRMIQSTVAAIPQNGNEVIKKLGNGAVECLQLVSDLWRLNPGREALQRVATNATRRVRDFLECLYTNVSEGQAQVLPVLLCGVSTRNRQDDNRVVLCNRSPPSNSSQSNLAPDHSPQPILSQPNTAPDNPAPDNPPLPNLPPPNSTLGTVMAATMQMLDYVRKYKWWIIGGAVVSGGAAAGVAVVGGGAVAASVAAKVVGGGVVGALAGLAAKKVKDKCTQPPPHEHQD